MGAGSGFGQSRIAKIVGAAGRVLADIARIAGQAMTDPSAMAEDLDPRVVEPRARSRRGLLRRIMVAAGSLLIMALVVMLGLFLLLSAGPVRMPLLGERVAAALEQRIGSGISVGVRDVMIEKTGAGLELHAYDLSFRDAAGKEVLAAPEAFIAFDPLALASLRLSPRSLRLRGLTVRATVRPDWDIRFSTVDARADGVEPSRPTEEFGLKDALALMAEVARTGRLSGLDELAVSEARLVIDDQRVGREIAFEGMSAAFAAPVAGRAVLSGGVTRAGRTTPYRIEAVSQDDGARLNLSITNIPLRVAETIGGSTALAIEGDSTAVLHATLLVAADGTAKSGAGDMRLTPGAIVMPALFEGPWHVSEARIEAGWSAGEPWIAPFRARFSGDGGSGTVAGRFHLAEDATTGHRIDGKVEELALSPLSQRDGPVSVSEGSFAISFPPSARKMIVETLRLSGPGTDIELSGELRREADGPAANLKLATGRMPIRTALRWWPTGVSSGGRTWMASAVESGMLRSLAILLDLPPAAFAALIRDEPLPPESLRIDVQVEDTVVRALDGLPPVTGITGTGWLDARRGELLVQKGAVDVGGGPSRRIQLADGLVQIAGLDSWTPDLVIGFRAQSSADGMAELLRSPPLRDVFQLDVNPQDIRGQFDGRARVSFQLGKALSAGDVRTEAQATLRNVTLEKAIGSERLEGANLAISADGTGVEVKGDGRWRGMPVQVTLESDSSEKSTATTLAFAIDEAQQRRMGLAGKVTGPLPVKVRALREQGEGLRAKVEVDLQRAAIDGLIPGFQKPAGRAGRLTFEAIERARAYQLQNIALDSGASSFRGTADVGTDGVLASARFSLFRLSPGDNVRLEFDRTPTGGRVSIRGNSLDARPFLKAATQDGPVGGRGEPDFDLDLKTTLLSGNHGEVLTNAEVRLQRRSGQMRQVSVAGRLNGKSLSITGQAADRPAPLAIESEDAGAFLRFADIYTRMQGGDLAGQIRQTPRDIAGFISARNFSLRNEPALRRLLSEGAPEAGAARGDPASFTKMRIDFTRVGTATTIRDALIFGPQIGVTFNGVVDTGRDRVSLSGTFIPAYGLNNAFASIPVFGSILAGGRNEGLLGVTFGVSGKASQPDVTVNPLSAVAPGIFRRIFEFRNERTGSAVPGSSPAPGPAN